MVCTTSGFVHRNRPLRAIRDHCQLTKVKPEWKFRKLCFQLFDVSSDLIGNDVQLWYRATLLWLLILCTLFLIATGQAWARGLEISCGCMNLDFLQLSGMGNGTVKLLESAPFAFGRALLLTAGCAYLLRDHSQKDEALKAS